MHLSLLFRDFHSKLMKILSFLLLSLVLFFNAVVIAWPQDCFIDANETRSADQFLTECAGGTTGIDPSGYTGDMDGTRKQIVDIANGAISFGALLAVWALVWSGIQYTKAYGEDEKLKKAKATWTYSLIGLILLLVAFGLVDIFINFIYTITGN